tara:strand:+ start:167 stop:358 length:192 start_codon:yes stop_codon:yes gene_type:complete
MFISKDLKNLVVDIGVPETLATKLSELNRLEYLAEPLKKNKLAPNSITKIIPIQLLFKALIKF